MKKLSRYMAATALSISALFTTQALAEDPAVQADAITNINAMKNEDPVYQDLRTQSTETLVQRLDTRERTSAIYILGERAVENSNERSRITDILINTLKETGLSETHWQAAYFLEQIAEVADEKTAMKIGSCFRLLLRTNGDFEVRAKAAAGLGTIAELYPAVGTDVFGLLIGTLTGDRRDHDGDVRHKATRALASLALKRPDARVLQATYDLLLDGLHHDGDSHVRWQSAISIGWLAGNHAFLADGAMNNLRISIETEQDKDVVIEAIASISKIAKGRDRYIPAAVRYLHEIAADEKRDPDVRAVAAELVKDIERPVTVAQPSPN